MATIDGADIAKHSTKGDCWTVIHGKVWNISGILISPALLTKYA